MHSLGRLFIVLIFVASIMFMSFSVVLYSTHTNWRKHSEQLAEKLKQKEGELAALKKAKADMETALQTEIQGAKDRNTKLTETIAQIKDESEKAAKEIAALREESEKRLAAVKAAEDTTAKLRERYDAASKALLTAQEDWANMANELTEKVDEAHSLALQLSTYQSVSSQLAVDYRDAIDVLKKHGLKPEPALYDSKPPAGIHGLVTDVRPKGMVEISVGADSGLVKGHQLDVVRNLDGRSSYIGKIEIVDAQPDKAVARVMPEFRRGSVQKNDDVQYIDINELTAK